LSTAPSPNNKLFVAIHELKQYGLLLKSQGASKGQIALDLASELHIKAGEFFKKEATPEELKQFQDEFTLLLNSKNDKMAEYRTNWTTIIANIAIALTGIGALFLAGQLLYSQANDPKGRALFFFQKSKTTSEEKVDEVQQALRSLGKNE
jgi:hypothetical protein